MILSEHSIWRWLFLHHFTALSNDKVTASIAMLLYALPGEESLAHAYHFCKVYNGKSYSSIPSNC
jgi:hypothetical protein